MSGWNCSYCGHRQLTSGENLTGRTIELMIGETVNGRVGFAYTAIRCLNAKCNNLTLSVRTGTMATAPGAVAPRLSYPLHQVWQLLPESTAKPQPEYILEAIRQDYYEACKIRSDSPKASATLARRCLQGMIRDFCGIQKDTLFNEIKELEKKLENDTAPRGVDDETIAAITAVRKLGNIGAHMEKDINIIVDVDPEEAQTLIELIEMLFADWYVARHKRQQRLASIQEITAAKEAQKNGSAVASSVEDLK